MSTRCAVCGRFSAAKSMSAAQTLPSVETGSERRCEGCFRNPAGRPLGKHPEIERFVKELHIMREYMPKDADKRAWAKAMKEAFTTFDKKIYMARKIGLLPKVSNSKPVFKPFG